MTETKVCLRCDVEKPFLDFHKDIRREDGLNPYCKQCRIIREKYYRSKPSSKTVARKHHLSRSFGIDISQYNLLLESQNYRCAICKSKETGTPGRKHFNIDHCHKTGKIRGLLCRYCNLLLGHSKDDPSILYKAADYLMGVETL